MDDLVRKFKHLCQNAPIVEEPLTSKKLLSYEKLYQVNSCTVFKSKEIDGIPFGILKDWRWNYCIFQIMKGNESEINTIKILEA